MADGPYRFHQPGTGQFYTQHHNQQVYQQQQQQRHIARNGSPVNGARTAYNNDTPSPSRSPISHSAGQNHYGMFNQGHQQGQPGIMNGGSSHQQRYMPMNLPHKFQQHQSSQQHHGPQRQVHQHAQGGHPGQAAIGHQHSFSTGLTSNSTTNYSSAGLHNGNSIDDPGDMGEPVSEHWQEQLQLYADLRQSAATSHRHTKKPGAVLASRAAANSLSADSQKDAESLDRNRAMTMADDQRQDWDGLDLSGQGLRALSVNLFNNYTFLTKLFIDNNKLAILPAGISQLRNLETLQASNNQLRELPASIGMLVRLKQLLVFDNLIRTLPCEIGHLFRLEMLGVEGNPLDEDIKDILVQQGTHALIVHIRDATEGGAPPEPRRMIVVDPTEAAEKVSVLDHNILNKKMATRAQYGATPAKALAWDYRRELILQDIKGYDADIVCLQEVDSDTYNDFFRRELAVQHYKGIFWPKSRARTMADAEARQVDGCATFYKGQKFVLLDKHLIDFANTAINRPDMKGEHDIFNRVMPRDNIAVVCFFENRMTGSRMIVANVHIHWDPFLEDVKLVQVAIMMEQITKLADRWATFPPCLDKAAFKYTEQDSEMDPEQPEAPPAEPGPSLEYSEGAHIPLIICGDFNSAKGSGVYDLLEGGAVSHDHQDFGDRSYGNFTRDGMAHPFHLKSAYDVDIPDGEEALDFTNYTPDFSGFIDYIWHSNNLRVKQILGNIDNDYLLKIPGFPHFHFPSDHLPTYAEFSVEARKERPKAVDADFGPQRERRH